MQFPSHELVTQAVALPPIDPCATLRMSIHKTLVDLKYVPSHWIEFDARRIPEEQLALIVSDLVLQGWKAEIKKRFSFLHWYSGLPMPTSIRVRG